MSSEQRHLDQSPVFIHFTGRPRQFDDKPPRGIPATAEDRLVAILQSGRLLAFSSYGSPPVVCVSESTRAAVAGMVTAGVTARGPYKPWGLLLNRPAAIEAGFRPVVNLTRAEQRILSRCDGLDEGLKGLIVTYEPANGIDWLTEREWRFATREDQWLDLDGLVHGVAVARQGWEPPADRNYAKPCRTLKRYYLDRRGETPRFEPDGQLTI